MSTKTKGLNSNTAPLHIACHVLPCPIIICSINGSLSTFLKDVLAMKLFEAQDLHINVWSHWIHFLYMFTLSQTGLEKAVGDWCLVLCAQGGFYFPVFCSSDRSGNYRPRAACTHRESDLYADVFACCVCPLATLCANHTTAAFFKAGAWDTLVSVPQAAKPQCP